MPQLLMPQLCCLNFNNLALVPQLWWFIFDDSSLMASSLIPPILMIHLISSYTYQRHLHLHLYTHTLYLLSLIHISEPTRLLSISYAVFCLKKKKKKHMTTI